MAAPVRLASRSPRRADLLRAAAVPFLPGPFPDVDETPPPGLGPEAVALALARRKADAAVRLAPGETVLTADTVVAVDDELLAKPSGAEDAARMLARLSGRTHRVVTAVVVARGGARREGTACAEVTFRPLGEAEIRAYVATGEPLDKAGAYAIQGGAAGFVAALRGDEDTVVGLPVALVRRLLECGTA